jgi:methyl-accepting chemotaxis protein
MDTTGDPAGMRQQAALVRTTADAVDALIARLQHDVEAMDFEGPAATRARSAWLDREHRARHVIGELREIAEQMTHEAHVVEERMAHGPGLG